jgi:murein DD-endopeptidase MepM/ murein hydrolase activator NlpD
MDGRAKSGLIALTGLAIALLASGCAQQSRPAPVSYGGGQSTSPAGGQVRVQAGDTVYSIARRFNVPVRTLIETNNLQPPYQLVPGSVLVLSQSRTHKVERGEYLSLIARKYQVDTSALARANNLGPPYTIYPNQVLNLPSSMVQAPAVTAEPAPTGLGRMVLTSPNAASGSGGPATSSVVAAPPPPAAVPRLPPRGELLSAPPATSAPVPAPDNAATAARPELVATAPPSPPENPRENSVPQPPTLAGSGFVWPVKGKVIAEFGPTGKGQHNDGINIAAERGTPVKATENGVVAYAGNELRGFGNLLLIKHADGWMSAYAHNEELLVSRGDQVRRGQVIAKVGSSGGVTQPQLHFELRKGAQSVNPLEQLKDSQALLDVDGRSPS